MAFCFSLVKGRFRRSIPLIPVHSGLFVFIALLSPMTWGASGPCWTIVGSSFLLGIICAYSTTIFVDEYLKK
jgi:hypothetical protein